MTARLLIEIINKFAVVHISDMFKATLSVAIFALCMNKIDHQFLVNIVFDVNRKKSFYFLLQKKHISPGRELFYVHSNSSKERIGSNSGSSGLHQLETSYVPVNIRIIANELQEPRTYI